MAQTNEITNGAPGGPLSMKSQVLETGAAATQVRRFDGVPVPHAADWEVRTLIP